MRQFFGRRRNRRGSTLVEFALVSVPLVLIMFGFVEFLLMVATSVMLNNATSEAARVLYTGQFQKRSENTEKDLKEFICNQAVLVVLHCPTNLLVDLHDFGAWKDVNLPELIDGYSYKVDPEPSATEPVEICGERIAVLRVLYRWELYTPGLSSLVRGGPGWLANTYLFQARVFIVEPWDFTGGSSC